MTAPNARCRACLKPVLLARTEAHGKRFLVDPEEDPAGNQAVFQDPQGAWHTRQLGKDDSPYSWETVHQPHLHTCPKKPPVPPEPPPLPPNVIPIGRAPSRRHGAKPEGTR